MYYGLQLKGNLKHETMKSALHATLEIHGKLGCVITRQASSWKRWFQYVWKFQEVNSSNVLKFLAAQDHDIELNRGAHYYRDLIFKHSMDISKEPGLRIFLITRDEECLLLFAFHHAATDGRGALNFVETFISQYNAFYFNRKPANKEVEKHTYPDKSIYRHSIDVVRSFLYMVRHQYRVLREPLIKVSPKTQGPDSKEALVIARKVEREEFENILALGRRKSIRLPDLLLAGIYFTVKKWNNTLGESETGRISFLASVGLAQAGNKYVGNLVAGMAINLSTKDNVEKNEVLKNIAKEGDVLRKYNDASSLLDIFQLMPIWFRQRVLKWGFKRIGHEQNKRFPTMRVANMGMLKVVNFSQEDGAILGDAKLQNIILSPANVNEVPFLLFHIYKKSLYAYLVVLKSAFSQESAEEFLALLVQELLEF